jgi:hypothetical protein
MNPTIIVPYRNRLKHLQQFLPHYRRLFPSAPVLIIEQSINKPFNAFKLLNIGAKLSWDTAYYFCFHDVDMLVQGISDYSYPESPTHLATNASQFKWQMPFPEYFGGVTLFNKADFDKCNGFSNNFYCWGGGDNEMYYRVKAVGLDIATRPHRYLSLPHPKTHPVGFDEERMKQAKKKRKVNDGLNNLEYKVIGERGITNGKIITVDI